MCQINQFEVFFVLFQESLCQEILRFSAVRYVFWVLTAEQIDHKYFLTTLFEA